MERNIDKFSATLREKGLIGVVKRIARYLTNWRVRRENMIWFWSRLHIGKSMPMTRVHGFKFCLHSNDPGISRELAIYHVHEPHATELYKSCVKEGMSVLDIGSNLGYYALLATKLVGQSGKVLAIEPEANNYAMLTMNVKKNAIRNIETLQIAVGDKDGISEFYITEASNTNSLISSVTATIVSSVQVETKKLDTLIRERDISRVDLVRMDIEGGEIIAVSGMHETLKKFKPTILIELHCDTAGAGAIVQFLKKLKTYDYDAECIVDRDRDFAWMKSRSVVSPITIDKLIGSVADYRVVTALLK